jgi:hypothetical protein
MEQFRKTNNQELLDLCESSSRFRKVKCPRLKWDGHVNRMRDVRNV